jgi:hypothetical protein
VEQEWSWMTGSISLQPRVSMTVVAVAKEGRVRFFPDLNEPWMRLKVG